MGMVIDTKNGGDLVALDNADLALVTSVTGAYTNPMVAELYGTPTAVGVMAAAGILVKYNNVTIGPDPDQLDPTTVTTDPKVMSYPASSPKGTISSILFERYYYGRVIPPQKPYRSTISVVGSDVMATSAGAQYALNDISFETNWGGYDGTVPPSQVIVNCYGAVRKGNYLYAASQDYPRVTKIRLSDMTVVGATPDYTPQPGLQAFIQSIMVTASGTLLVAINECIDPWGTTPAAAGYVASTIVEIVPGNNDAPPSFSPTNKKTITQTTAQDTYSCLNAVKLTFNDEAIYVAGIGGPQMFGTSNGKRSTVFRIPLTNGGTLLGIPQVVYYGDSDETKYDIRDIELSEDSAMILVGRYESDVMTFTFTTLRQPLADTQTITGLSNTNEVSITNLITPPWSAVNSDSIAGGAYHTIKYEKSYKHWWCCQSIRILIYDNSVISDFLASPTLGRQLDPTDWRGSRAGYLNSVDPFCDNIAQASPPTPQKAVRAMAMGDGGAAAGAGSSSAYLAKVKPYQRALQAYLAKLRKLESEKKDK